MRLSAIDILIVLAYMALMAYIAWVSRRFAGKSLENYFLAGRSMPGWMAGISYAASMMSADSAVGYGGMAVVTGLFVCWFYLARFGLAFFIGAMLFAVYWKRLNTFTTLEFYELRFSGKPARLMRLWLAIRSSLIAMVAWTAIALLASVKIVGPVLGLSKTQTLLLVLPVTIAYLYFSGYVGVVLSNLIQVAVIFVGTLIVALKVVWAVGGPQHLGETLTSHYGQQILSNLPPAQHAYFPFMAALAWLLGTSVGYGGDAAPMSGAVEGQRILSTRSPREACQMYLVTEISLFTMVFLVSVPCLAAVTLWPQLRSGQTDRELAYGMLMARFLGPGLLGLVFVTMLAGIMAVVGDNLNFGSQILMNDIYKRHFVPHASDKHYLFVGRACIFIILGLALLVVYKVHFLFDVAIFMVGLATAEMSGNWAQWWWWRFNGWGRVAASFGGGVIYLALVFGFPQMQWWTRMYLIMVISTALWLLVTLITSAEPAPLLEAFYARARPMGWWGAFRRHGLSAGADGGAPSGADGLKKISKGLLIASVGATSVIFYILGISNLYFGKFLWGGVQLLAMVILAALFWRFFSPYVVSLLTPEEVSHLISDERAHLPEQLGFRRILAFALGIAAVVLAADSIFFSTGQTRWLMLCAMTVAAGCGWRLWR
jgi:Na+/proline symporter